MNRIFVGTLYSGENEFEECLASIQNQTYQNFKHFIYKNLPNVEAHHTLFSDFKSKADQFDFLVKVDADMVICSDQLFANIVRKMTDDPEIDVFSIAVRDFFSGELINGLNTYRNSANWDFTKDTMFVDIPEVSRERTFFDQTDLAPAAIHCKNPSNLQAFHYGVHRGLKSIQKIHSTTHWAFLEKTWQNFLEVKDPRIGLAVLGAELVYAGKFTKADVDYTNPKVSKVLEQYREMGFTEIKKEIIQRHFLNLGFLPNNIRRRFIRNLRRTGNKPPNA